MVSCIVCNHTSQHNDQWWSLDDSIDNGETLRCRLEKVLEEAVNGDKWMCCACQFDLTEIETYYVLLTAFKQRCRESLQQQLEYKVEEALSRGELFHTRFSSENLLKLTIALPTVSSDGKTATYSQDNRLLYEKPEAGRYPDEKIFNNIAEHECQKSVKLEEEESCQEECFGDELEAEEFEKKKPKRTQVNNLSLANTEYDLSKSCNRENRTSKEHDSLHTDTKPQTVNCSFICQICDRVFKRSVGLCTHIRRAHQKKGLLNDPKSRRKSSVQQTSTTKNTGRRPRKTGNGPEQIPFDQIKTESATTVKKSNVKESDVPQPDFGSPPDHCVKESHTETGYFSEITCPICNEAFAKNLHLNRHMKSHGKKPFICDLCKKGYPSAKLLHKHMLEHTGEKPFVCSVCDRAFRVKRDLETHTHQHTGLRPFVCIECGKGFAAASRRKYHMIAAHSDERPHKCDKCAKGFIRPERLRLHRASAHGEDSGTSCLCNVCGAKLVSSASLKTHMKTHSSERLPCAYCEKTFRQKHALKLHLRIHTGEKTPANHVCQICGKAFEMACELRTHMPMHTGEKRFFCSLCSNGFRFRQELKIHMRGHTDERPFPCEICSKHFRTSSARGIHMRTHTGERPYPCTFCRKAFKSSSHLKRHLLGVHTVPGSINWDKPKLIVPSGLESA